MGEQISHWSNVYNLKLHYGGGTPTVKAPVRGLMT